MKKFIVIAVLVIVLGGAAFLFIGGNAEKPAEMQKASFGTAAQVSDFEIVADANIVTAKQLNGDEDQFDEFLTTDMTNYGDTTLCDITLVTTEGNTAFVVSYTMKNIAQQAETFDEKIYLNYNNGYEYEVSESYYSLGGIDNWHKFTSVTVNPLSTLYCKAYFTVPDEVVNNTAAPLTFAIGNQEYTIR